MFKKIMLKIFPRKYLLFFYRTFFVFFSLNPIKFISSYKNYILDLFEYRRKNNIGSVPILNLYPQIHDKTSSTPVDTYYFYQDTWCAAKVFQNKPEYHVDIGSSALLVGILSQFTKVCSVDIRPLKVCLDGLECKKGSLLNLPFEDNSIHSLSSLCVLEHVGLGRYGDEIDPKATDKAIIGLQRVTIPGGNLYISVPIDTEDTVYFNAHKAFEYSNFVKRFSDMELIEVKFIQKGRMYDLAGLEKLDLSVLVVGLFHFRKRHAK